SYLFREKTMYRGKEIRVHDEIFVFASDHLGGQGLVARGVVMAVDHGPGTRVSIKVRRTDLDDDQPQTEIARKLYRQATNKISGISDEAAKFLNTYFLGRRTRTQEAGAPLYLPQRRPGSYK
ncbi:MAG: hypothetical protein M3Z23_03510, partial [Acidobacteriota bacterium]|nr:hypothetical protein [Acidobacteriota bacterium]